MGANLLHTKDYLILTSIDIIEDLGIQGLTTREIAKRQNVSEATIFRHYKNKNELLLAVLDYYKQFDADIYQSIQLAELEPLNAIRYYILEYAEYYENYRAITSITQLYDVLRYDPKLAQKVNEIQSNRTNMLTNLINNAKHAGELIGDIEGEMIAVMIIGFMKEICLNWRLENYSFSYKDRTKETLEVFLSAFQKVK